MIVIGGSYHEVCDWPDWDRILGPGVRAALAVSALSPGTVLHTCAPASRAADIRATAEAAGVATDVRDFPDEITFFYKHPIATPSMEPRELVDTAPSEPWRIAGDAVLAFGMLETAVRIDANRAVFELSRYDKGLERGNVGSLAIVCTKSDLPDVFTPGVDVRDAAADLLSAHNADLMVVRGELGGAAVFIGDTRHDVPAYAADKWFKIGAGNVFCAMFAHYWGEKKLDPVVAADLASKSAAHYASAVAGALPMVGPEALPQKATFNPAATGKVFIASPCYSMAQQWLLDQAILGFVRFGIECASPYDLGLDGLPTDERGVASALDDCNAILALADGADLASMLAVGLARVRRLPIVVLSENARQRRLDLWDGTRCEVAEDFASAVYRAAVAALGGAS